MKKTLCLATLALLALAPALRAVEAPTSRATDTNETTIDPFAPGIALIVPLGEGLGYTRPDSNRPTPAQVDAHADPVILDLRYFAPAKDVSDVWLDVIGTLARPHRPVFVLISPETSRAILDALAPGMRDCITIGRAAPGFHPDIVVDTTTENDHAAWLAAGQGKVDALQKLITPIVDKPRNDEAALAKQHAAELAGTDDSDSSADDSATSAAPDARASTSKPKPAPLIDAVLLRAVQIDRGLLALKKL